MPQSSPQISVARIKKGLQLFLAFSVVGFVIVMMTRSSVRETLHHLSNFDLRWLGVALALVVFDWFVAATRIYLFAHPIEPRAVTYGSCMRSCFANVFLGGATPSQTGGAAAQIYVLYADGMSIMGATVACFVGGFLGTALILLACAVVFSFVLPPDFIGSGMRFVSGASFTLFALIVLASFFSLASPRGLKRVVHGILKRLPWVSKKLEERHAVERLFETVDRYHALMTGFLVHRQLRFGVGLLLTTIIYINKFLIAWVVLRGMGIHAGIIHVMYMQVVLLLIFYFSPSPGASGVAEVTTMAVMGSIIPKGMEPTFVLMWRFFTLVLNMMIGAGVLVSYLSGKRGRRPNRPETPEPEPQSADRSSYPPARG
jgi:uncharacterized protein (TIRG00374 family)